MKPTQNPASVNVGWFHSTRRGIAPLSGNSPVPRLRIAPADLSEAYGYPLYTFAQSEGRQGS